MRQTLLYHLLRQGVVVGVLALDKRYSLPEHGDVALENAIDILVGREQAATRLALHIGVYDRRLCNAFIDGQSGILLVVFRVFHIEN